MESRASWRKGLLILPPSGEDRAFSGLAVSSSSLNRKKQAEVRTGPPPFLSHWGATSQDTPKEMFQSQPICSLFPKPAPPSPATSGSSRCYPPSGGL